MFSNLQISRTLVKNEVQMDSSKKTVSQESMQAEWQQIRAAQDNPAQFRPLYDRYFEPIFRFIYRRTNNEDIAADLSSQVFLKALQKLNRYQFKGVPFSAWLYRIASNEIAQHYRDTQKNRIVSLEGIHIANLIDEIKESDHQPQQQAMIQAIDALKPEDIQLIELRFFEVRPFKEIADILDITESNAKVKTYRILEKLKKHIHRISTKGGRAPEL